MDDDLINRVTDVNVMYICTEFDSTALHLREPNEKRALIKAGQKTSNYWKSVWGDYVDLNQSKLKFAFYEDEFLKLVLGYVPTNDGGVEKRVVAVQVTPGDIDNDGELVYCWDAEEDEQMVINKNGWQEKLTDIANAISCLRRQFFPPRD